MSTVKCLLISYCQPGIVLPSWTFSPPSPTGSTSSLRRTFPVLLATAVSFFVSYLVDFCSASLSAFNLLFSLVVSQYSGSSIRLSIQPTLYHFSISVCISVFVSSRLVSSRSPSKSRPSCHYCSRPASDRTVRILYERQDSYCTILAHLLSALTVISTKAFLTCFLQAAGACNLVGPIGPILRFKGLVCCTLSTITSKAKSYSRRLSTR